MVKHVEKLWSILNPETKPLGQCAADLVHTGVHVLGRIDYLVVLGPDLLTDTVEAGCPHLEVRHPDHVIIAHGHSNIFRGALGEAKPKLLAGMTAIDSMELPNTVK